MMLIVMSNKEVFIHITIDILVFMHLSEPFNSIFLHQITHFKGVKNLSLNQKIICGLYFITGMKDQRVMPDFIAKRIRDNTFTTCQQIVSWGSGNISSGVSSYKSERDAIKWSSITRSVFL